MMPSAVPQGLQRERELVKRLDEVKVAAKELQTALRFVNDAELRTQAEALAAAISKVLALHQDHSTPAPSVADDLTGLMSATRALRAPAEDTELGRIDTLQRLRAAKGLIVVALGEALDAARVLGLYPRQPSLPQELPIEIPRNGNEWLLAGIAKRLDELVTKLDELDKAKAEPTIFPQQTGLLNFYVGAMRVEIDLAGLHLTVGENTFDFGALFRAVDVITELTSDFCASIRGWGRRVSNTVSQIAEELRARVRRLATGTSTVAKWIGRKARLAREVSAEPNHPSAPDGYSGGIELSFDPSDPECVRSVEVWGSQTDTETGKVIPTHWFGKSIRLRVQANSNIMLKNAMAYITKVEKLTAHGEWHESKSPDIQTTWIDSDAFLTDIPGEGIKYVNVIHVNDTENKITVWRMSLPHPLADFVEDLTTYRFTISVMAQGITRNAQIEIDWQGQWDTIQARSA